jgi:hypothetical protein
MKKTVPLNNLCNIFTGNNKINRNLIITGQKNHITTYE